MRYNLKITVIGLLIIRLVFSCSIEKNRTKNRNENKSYSNYLSSLVNDTTFFEIPELQIVDSNIHPVLDSVILWSERCKYFDTRIKYLYSFRFAAKPEGDKLLYFIDAHLSPASAIGLSLIEAGIIKRIDNNNGIFYYRHFLFVVPIGNYRGQKELEYFPFVKQSGNKLKIRAPEFLDEKVYSSYITFNKLADKYKIKENEICGSQILIR